MSCKLPGPRPVHPECWHQVAAWTPGTYGAPAVSRLRCTAEAYASLRSEGLQAYVEPSQCPASPGT
ncbi:MAG: hypothetical protein E7E72_15130 [Clostridium sp.]|nr:hypothetical protein [Clostridium sp.]